MSTVSSCARRFSACARRISLGCTLFVGCLLAAGCAEGPLYSTGWVSPYAIDHWKKEESYGPTVIALREQQVRLREALPTLSPAERESAVADLGQKFRDETNQTLRLEYLKTVGVAQEPSAIPILVGATGDRSQLVRAAACDALKGRNAPEAQERLRDLAESDVSVDVRLAAIRAMEGDASEGTLGTMGRLLEDDDPAIQFRTMATLEATTGKELGKDRRAWTAYLAGEEPEIRQASWFEGWSPFY
jgi:HEAT repeat protein